MSDGLDVLDAVLEQSWGLLAQGLHDRHSPFRQGVLATYSDNGPQARYVVLRHVDKANRCIGFHSDYRADKIVQIQKSANVSWCFFGDKQQLRLSGIAAIHAGDAIAEAAWQATSNLSRRCYLTEQAPGTQSDIAASGLSAELEQRQPSTLESTQGFTQFAVIRITLESIEWLHLGANGHRRARFDWHHQAWQGSWLIP
jgi:pyridoxamine 5'-phosphate oxidase